MPLQTFQSFVPFFNSAGLDLSLFKRGLLLKERICSPIGEKKKLPLMVEEKTLKRLKLGNRQNFTASICQSFKIAKF